MNLPDLGLQIVYDRLAWGIVLAALLVQLWPRRTALGRGAVLALTLAMLALQALPGAISPAFALGTAFRAPSCLLLALCLVKLANHAGAGAVATSGLMAPRMALLLAGFGTLLYLDAMGLTAMGLYYWGFGPRAAPLIGLLIGAGSALALASGQARAQAMALLLATLGFALLRLPTGNLWDALLDPLLWLWSLGALAAWAWRRKFPGRSAPV